VVVLGTIESPLRFAARFSFSDFFGFFVLGFCGDFSAVGTPYVVVGDSDGADVAGLHALLALRDLKLDPLSL
jgi:hypothetical protein